MDATAWDARYRSSELVWSADPNATVASETADLTPGRALDLGAGEGRNAVFLAERGWRVTAIDFSPVAIGKGRAMADARGIAVDWVTADVTVYPFERATYDLVLLSYLQLPRLTLRALHARAAAAVAPGGTLLIVGHDRSNLEGGYGGPQDPDVLLEPDEVVGDLAGSGLQIQRAERVTRPVTTDDGPRTAVDCLVRAVRPAERRS